MTAAPPPAGPALEADRLVAQAVDATGLVDFGEDSWCDGLDRLLASQREEAALSELGEQLAAGEVVLYLSNRLRVTDWHRKHPETTDAAILPPIVIVGQGRTGTTILHDLLSQDTASRVPLTWEVDHPCPPPDSATYDTDPRIAQVDATLAALDVVLPGFKAMHPMGARLAQECVRITGGDFRSLIFSTQYRVPAYNRWLLDEADMASAYRWHRRLLQVLQCGHPGRRWVLKSPAHQWCLGAVLSEYPDAMLVQTHRDPLHVIASLASLIATLRSVASAEASLHEVAREFADLVLGGLDRSVQARTDGTVAADRVFDVHFGAFVSDPLATVRRLYAWLGFELTQEAERRMRAFLAENPRDKHGHHAYTFADSGLDAGALRARARSYQEYFDVPSEPLP